MIGRTHALIGLEVAVPIAWSTGHNLCRSPSDCQGSGCRFGSGHELSQQSCSGAGSISWSDIEGLAFQCSIN